MGLLCFGGRIAPLRRMLPFLPRSEWFSLLIESYVRFWFLWRELPGTPLVSSRRDLLSLALSGKVWVLKVFRGIWPSALKLMACGDVFECRKSLYLFLV